MLWIFLLIELNTPDCNVFPWKRLSLTLELPQEPQRGVMDIFLLNEQSSNENAKLNSSGSWTTLTCWESLNMEIVSRKGSGDSNWEILWRPKSVQILSIMLEKWVKIETCRAMTNDYGAMWNGTSGQTGYRVLSTNVLQTDKRSFEISLYNLLTKY